MVWKRSLRWARGDDGVPRLPSDWVTQMGESLQETITRVMGLGLEDMDQVLKVREVVAIELTKLVYRYKIQPRLVHVTVVGFQIQDMIDQIQNWVPQWKVSWTNERKQLFQQMFPAENKGQADALAESLESAGAQEVTVCLT